MLLFMASAIRRPTRIAPWPVGIRAAAALATLTCLVPVASARADTVIATARIAPGSLAVGGGAATVDPSDAQRLLMPLDVTDARGNGAGWSVYLTARPTTAPSRRTASLTAPLVQCATNSTCTLPVSTISYPLNVPLTGAAVKVLNAAPGTGMGGMTTTLALNGAGAAQSVNTTVTVASGP